MKRSLITMLLLCSLHVFATAQNDPGNYVFRFPGTDLRGLAQLPKATRDSILTAFSRFDPAALDFSQASPQHGAALRSVLVDMMETVRTVIQNPATADEMDRKMTVLQRKMDEVQENIIEEDALRQLKQTYENDRARRTREFELRNYDNDREQRMAKRQLEQELRDLRKDYEEERARLRHR